MKAEERREQVLAAAVEEFALRGYEGTSTEDIARRADISQPYLFRLFPTKKALFLATVELGFTRVSQILLEASQGLSGEEAMQAMGDSYRSYLEDRPLLLTQLHAYAACSDPEIRSVVQTCFGKLWVAIAEVTGAPDEKLVEFFAKGMLLNVAAAMDLPSVMNLSWVRACMAGFVDSK